MKNKKIEVTLLQAVKGWLIASLKREESTAMYYQWQIELIIGIEK